MRRSPCTAEPLIAQTWPSKPFWAYLRHSGDLPHRRAPAVNLSRGSLLLRSSGSINWQRFNPRLCFLLPLVFFTYFNESVLLHVEYRIVQFGHPVRERFAFWIAVCGVSANSCIICYSHRCRTPLEVPPPVDLTLSCSSEPEDYQPPLWNYTWALQWVNSPSKLPDQQR